jgi:hypothetical protein
MEQLIAELRHNTAAQRELADALRMQAAGAHALAGAVHALADSLAACTTEPSPQGEDVTTTAAPALYADGTPVGPY